jgi:predicted amidophosphoribosyltransferase
MLHLLDLLFPPRSDERTLRETSDDAFLALMKPRLVPETRPGTVVLLPFSAPAVRAAIHEAKYHGSERAFALLALALADYLRDADDVGFRKPNISLVPVPLGATRRRERGFNQVEEVARRALAHLGAGDVFTLEPYLLVRTRETSSQVMLARHEREENMRGAFAASRPLDPSRTYLVIDDVITTGATLQAALDALRAAGATDLLPIALAH